MTSNQKRSHQLSCEAESSNCLIVHPLEEKAFTLTKREFCDAVSLMSGCTLARLPSSCACGERFDMSYALSCKEGGFVAQRHNELRDRIANLLAEVCCCDVCVKPPLNELTGESLEMRSANTSSEA